MRLFWQYLQAYWRPLIGTFVQQPASSERPRPDSGGIGYAVLMEVKGVNG
ncbi:MAG: hypothetical protein U9N47_11630 [Thermodesulfobacteriota bacterium]|nr:hypothetical protein [Thermodesulfobacteriota bacterium]